MLAHVVATARALDPVDIIIVGSPDIARHLDGVSWGADTRLAIQDPPRGTADAVRIALNAGASGDRVLVLYADHPLVTAEALRELLSEFHPPHQKLAVMTCFVDDAAGYGRVQRDERNQVQAIIEKIDDDPSLRAGKTEINSGVMALDTTWARTALETLPPNPRKNEYFLTDLVAAAYASDSASIGWYSGPTDVLIGINDRVELAVADEYLRNRKRHALMQAGVTLIAPASNLIDDDVQIEPDTTIGPNCIIESGTRIGSGSHIGPNAVLRASQVGNRVRIESSTIEHSSIDDDSDVGPYSHIRGGSEIGPHVHIGNFAELKNAQVAAGVRIGHFSYIGDAGLGSNVNIGAGTVTCNFDGHDKHHTEIGAGAFIGSDSMLIAPVTIGAGARTGAGAVVTKDVPPGATVVGMPARRTSSRTSELAEHTTEGEG
jgi:bifunctional UDP-N-acetylglucosamine pyrophosphorylase/glucosamine-1-phosphate N-acetyltransferase